jgi:3-keto-disaccharide hydrolase
VDALRDAEVALAKATAPRLAAVQLSAEQLRAFIARGGVVAAGRGGRGGVPFYPTQRQMAGLQQMNAGLASQSQAATTARTALLTEAFGPKPDAAAIRAKADALGSAELSLAKARGDAFAKIQASPHKLSPEGVAAVAAAGGAYRTAGLGFTMPEPIDFNDHEGYISLFDGVSLKGWDGNPKFWSVKDGAIFGESTPQNPSGNNYIVYRDIEAKDFTLKFEVKVEGTGGTGIQYRSKTGLPAREHRS